MTYVYRLLVYVIAGWAGFFGMALEMLGVRVLAPYFGNGVYVWGAVITTYMLGLSTGYLMGGNLSVKDVSLRRLGVLMTLTTVTVAPLLLIQTQLLDVIFQTISDPRLGVLISSMLLFFFPALAIGTVSPYCVQLIIEKLSNSGRSAGKLYFVSTLGSTIGTLCTSFYLVLIFELNEMLTVLTAITFFVGVFTIWFDAMKSPAQHSDDV